MKVDVKKLDSVKRVLTIEVKGESFAKEMDQAYLEMGKDLKIPGFRPGTAPLELLEKHHGKILKEKFLSQALSNYYQLALANQKIIPAGYPKISDVECTKEGLCFKAELEVRPEIELKDEDYKGIKVKDVKIEVKDDEIQKVVDNLKEGLKKTLSKELSEDEMARWAGYSGIDNLKETVRYEIFVEKSRSRRQNINGQIFEQLLKNIKFDLPKSELEHHHQQLVERELNNLRQRGVSDADIEKYKSDVEEKLRQPAEEEMKSYYILEAIGKKEDLKAGENIGEAALGFILSQAEYK
jgi:FKBP-type peptidyl-prolyl cis-trans isomerase (trigger factor)